MLAYQDEGVGQQIERDGKAAALHTHHEFVFLQFRSSFVKYAHSESVNEERRRA
jgi:hypothetical protein